jgi:hypothetical protein
MKPLSDEEIISKLLEAEVPEPSPLFWQHLSQRVHDAVAVEPVPSRAWASRFNFAWAGGLVAAAAVMFLAVTVSMRHEPKTAPSAAVAPTALTAATTVADGAAADDTLPPVDDDASFAVIGDLASGMDFDELGAAGLMVAPGSADEVLSQMSGDEQRAVVELLQQEIRNSESL